MKPKTKKQKEIMALSGQLRPLTATQMQWAFNSTINHYAYRLKNGKAICMSCGHEWTADEGMTTCPHCGRKVKVETTMQRVYQTKAYFNVITAKGNYQVVRMFLLIAEFRKGMVANPAYLEIGQYWVDAKGGKTLVGIKRTMGYYMDSFAFGSPLEIRKDSEVFQRISDEYVYPRIKATDTIRRNGFDGHTHDINPVTLFQQLLSNPKAETLMKAREVELLRYLCNHPSDADKYWNTIKIARRAGYKVEDSKMWFDYIKMLERMGKDLRNAKLVAPSDLKAAHDEYMVKIERQRIKEQMEKNRKRAEADEAEFVKLKGKYLGLVMTDGEIIIHTLNSVAEYYEEGTRQHICVGSSSYYLKKNSLVFTAKIGNKTIATVEISLKDYSILQCRAFANGVCEYTDRIAEIIKSNTKLIRKRKRMTA
ncbi:PcfJ domain-containing protein [uncultured Duncaniella sp.]|jgi:predicted RNA-binding Zn-ribbon protein involved in translation (DUF1610 family)|uniref:PcfJ domain-containing protein n=1 Tax=uncultured Duncaniella sp. TaxID=2768039 RepID=UPI00272A1284|nr:PcfJ domain-containing protein [uncultured Duncaniella sp.]